ncbi:DNA polymerase I [Hymenobacter sp.]|uniref:DNA polymerase I n=1 Tax=Hymenobacter sp. TaxID=1898978 RepID=UPI00286C21BC|nr:DNA polymerase I [Hymenobacter sp.]
MTDTTAPTAPAKKLFLLDAFALIYRSHFAFSKNPRINSKGMNTGAVLGFTNTLVEVLQKEKPTHIGVCFDGPKKTFRHEQFAAYKAQRQAMPEDIGVAIPYIKKIIQGFHIPILMMDGFEADDVIGTLAQKAEKEGFEVFMMTPDKDYCQLVTENIKIYRPAFMGNAAEILDVAHVLARFEIERVEQVIDILGLQGDASDNIPGIPGIGDKTAKALIKQFGSVENLIANADQLKGKQQENVRNFAEQGLMSKELATIHVNVPLDFEADQLVLDAPDEATLRALFDELEFRQLAARVLSGGPARTPAGVAKPGTTGARRPRAAAGGQASLFGNPGDGAVASGAEEGENGQYGAPAGPRKRLADVPYQYHLMDTPALRQALLSFLVQQAEVSFDTETTGLDIMTARLVGLSFCWLPGEAYYVPVPADDQAATQAIVDEFCPFFEAEGILKIGQNVKYDLTILRHYGVEVGGPLFDTMLAHYLIEPDMRHNMDVLAETYLHYSPVSILDLIGPKGKKQITMADVPPAEVKDYACEDADVTLQLKHVFEPMLQELGLLGLLNDVENPLVPVLSSIEYEGVRIDSGAMNEYSAELQGYITELEAQIFQEAGGPFNIGSPKQLGDILFGKMALPGGRKTATGAWSTDSDALEDLAAQGIELARRVVDWRQLAKLRSTYTDALPNYINPTTGRVHTSYAMAATSTGRLSSSDPNLQNIPVRTEEGRRIRTAFIAPPGTKLISADYSQIELRVLAHVADIPQLKKAFADGLDIHAMTASEMFGVPVKGMDPAVRRRAKAINFGIIYGISAFGLANQLSISREEAGDYIKTYFSRFPGIKTYMDETKKFARDKGYVETIFGRRCHFARINSPNASERAFMERAAINAPIQGAAADIIRRAMIRMQEALDTAKLSAKMLLQVHDELIFETRDAEIEATMKVVKHVMEKAPEPAVKLTVPLQVDALAAMNWDEAH